METLATCDEHRSIRSNNHAENPLIIARMAGRGLASGLPIVAMRGGGMLGTFRKHKPGGADGVLGGTPPDALHDAPGGFPHWAEASGASIMGAGV